MAQLTEGDDSISMRMLDADEEEIRQVIEKINNAWFDENTDVLYKYFHDTMVIYGPNMEKMGVGIEACVNSYKEFSSIATLHDLTVKGYSIDVWGDIAIGGYRFKIHYEMEGKQYHESGTDTFLFVRDDENRWRALWRMVGSPGGVGE